MTKYTTEYPEIYCHREYYIADLLEANEELDRAIALFKKYPSSNHWKELQQAMFDYQHVRINSRRSSDYLTAYRFVSESRKDNVAQLVNDIDSVKDIK